MRTSVRSTASGQVSVQDGAVQLEICGELSLASAYPLVSLLRTAASAERARCRIDLAGVHRASPGGLEALRDLIAAARGLFRAVCVVGPLAAVFNQGFALDPAPINGRAALRSQATFNQGFALDPALRSQAPLRAGARRACFGQRN